MSGWESVGPDGDFDRRMTNEQHEELIGQLPKQTTAWMSIQVIGMLVSTVALIAVAGGLIELMSPSSREPTLLEMVLRIGVALAKNPRTASLRWRAP